MIICSQQLVLNRSISNLSSLNYTSIKSKDMMTGTMKNKVKQVKVVLKNTVEITGYESERSQVIETIENR